MMTTATPELAEKSILLTKDGKKLFLKIESDVPVTTKTWSTTPATTYDAQNPGTILVGFEMKLEPGQKKDIQVMLVPENAGQPKFSKSLANWKN
jgi:hypothetical protein